MRNSLQPPLVAKNGRSLKVLGIARISTEHQDALSLEDQRALYESWLNQVTDLPYELIMISGRGSGESLQREEIVEAEREIDTGSDDLVLTEDLGRIFRRVHAHLFCEMCEDAATRLVAINDHVDTGQEDWRLHAFFATMRHEMYNADTGKRIRRTLRNRFMQGGVFQFVIYGYVKPPGTKSEDDVYKDPAAIPIYTEWFRRLEEKVSYAEVADWLNEQGIATGRHCDKRKWDGKMVSRVTHNPILKGMRARNDKVSKRVNRTGRRRAVKAPITERLERYCPHLAFFDAAYYDRVIRTLDRKNAKHHRKGVDGVDTRKGVPKKRTTWPGQHLCCGVCGRIFHWTGTPDRRMLICSGAETYRCWNSVLLNGELAIEKLSQAILLEIRALPEFDRCFLDEVQRQLRQAQDQQQDHRLVLIKKMDASARQIENLTTAVADGLGSRSLLEKLYQLESEQDNIQEEMDRLKEASTSSVELPSLRQIQEAAENILSSFVPNCLETGRLMRKLVTHLKVFPYRLSDGGAVVLRAKVKLALAALVANLPTHEGLAAVLQRELVVDLFDPPQRAQYREQVVQMREAGLTEKEVAKRLGITHTAAQRAAALNRLMASEGIDDPYIPVISPPEDYGKLRRHRHPRYRFEPLAE